MRGQGQHNPLGWAALGLVVVAYAHVILELAVTVLVVVIAVRMLISPAPDLIARHLGRQLGRYRARRRTAQRVAARQPAALNGNVVKDPANGSKASEPAEAE